jgi:ankyrin repeat/SOCS box protein 8
MDQQTETGNTTESGDELSFNQSLETISGLDKETVEYALDHGVDANEICDNHADSPSALHLFSRVTSDVNIIETLIAHGANVNALDNFNRSALMMASYNSSGVAFCLMNKGADVNQADDNGWHVMHWFAANCEHQEVVSLLVDAGAEVNHVNNRGMTPLSTCLVSGLCPEVLTTLINRGAGLPLKMFVGVDVLLGIAEEKGRSPEVIARFKKHYQNGEIRSVEIQ